MKALVKRTAAPGLWLEDVPEPTPGINDVLIRVDRAAIFGTNVHSYNWDAWAQKTIPVPMVVGYELVGEVIAVGADVADFHPRDDCRRLRPRTRDLLLPPPRIHRITPKHVRPRRQMGCQAPR